MRANKKRSGVVGREDRWSEVREAKKGEVMGVITQEIEKRQV